MNKLSQKIEDIFDNLNRKDHENGVTPEDKRTRTGSMVATFALAGVVALGLPKAAQTAEAVYDAFTGQVETVNTQPHASDVSEAVVRNAAETSSANGEAMPATQTPVIQLPGQIPVR